MTLAAELAAATNGTLRDGSLIIVTTEDAAHVIDCRPTGKVMLDGTYMLGRVADGVEHLAAMYYAATAEVPC